MLYESKFQIHKISISDVAIAYRIPRSTVDLFHNSKTGHLFGDYMYPATCESDA